mgnify:FL=1|jgi:hypothetical protein
MVPSLRRGAAPSSAGRSSCVIMTCTYTTSCQHKRDAEKRPSKTLATHLVLVPLEALLRQLDVEAVRREANRASDTAEHTQLHQYIATRARPSLHRHSRSLVRPQDGLVTFVAVFSRGEGRGRRSWRRRGHVTTGSLAVRRLSWSGPVLRAALALSVSTCSLAPVTTSLALPVSARALTVS